MKVVSVLFLVSTLLAVAYADLPVHCLYSQTKGDWQFFVTAQDSDKSVVAKCGIRTPITPTSNFNVNLGVPNIATDVSGNKGTWTLIYDQGFELIINNNRYFAFFNYTEREQNVVSHCGETFTGWYHEDGVDAKKWGCFRAKKVNQDESLIHTYRKPVLSNMNEKSVNNVNMIREINTVQNSWIATSYPQFENKTRAEILLMTGSLSPSFRGQARDNHMQDMKQYLPKKASISDLPKSFDWRNVDGQNYVSPVRNQGGCGSCYVFGTMGMFEARVKVATKNKQSPVFAPQEVVSCTAYAQGCAGGFPYLVEKYAQDFGVVEEHCYPYQGRDSACHAPSCTTPRQHFTDYGYIGGYYGANTEANMMENVYNYGPTVVNFEVLSDFYFYKSGIYHHVKTDQDPEPFVTVNHSVLVVGWGEQNGEKYWIVKNSWGSSWGMNGYFWIRRGTNEVGIESLSSTALPVL